MPNYNGVFIRPMNICNHIELLPYTRQMTAIRSQRGLRPSAYANLLKNFQRFEIKKIRIDDNYLSRQGTNKKPTVTKPSINLKWFQIKLDQEFVSIDRGWLSSEEFDPSLTI